MQLLESTSSYPQPQDVSGGGTVVGVGERLGGAAAVVWKGLLGPVDPLDAINEPDHHTDRYDINSPPDNVQQRTILRRASTARLQVVVTDCFDPAIHQLRIEAEHTFDDSAPTPVEPAWEISYELGPSQGGERIANVDLEIPADAAVGEYTLRAVVDDPAGNRIVAQDFERRAVVLFNPWSPSCTTYLPNLAKIDEYIISDTGLLWRGTARYNKPKPWSFAQYDEDVFLGSLELLTGLNAAGRADPAAVARWLTEKIDANDGGVLFGNWGDDYSGGTSPLSWVSSKDIFESYRIDGSVRYGQCWVFAGLLTSSLRALGIPARPVTNFESAHDSQADGYPADGLVERCWVFELPSLRWRNVGESVWNFHVWCEAWMRRPELSDGDGWQVVDATPQEISYDSSPQRFQLGPVPVSTIRNRLGNSYDALFVQSEIDAVVHDGYEASGLCTLTTDLNHTWVGRRITTKAVGTGLAEDITSYYKEPETTADPRLPAVIRVDIPPTVSLGQTIVTQVSIENEDPEFREFNLYVAASAVAQNGEDLGLIGTPTSELFGIQAGEVSTMTIDTPWDLIQPFTDITEFIQFDIVVTRVHDEHRWLTQRTVLVQGIPISLQLSPADRVGVNGEVVATIVYQNPLQTPLEGAVLTLSVGHAVRIGEGDTDEQVVLGTLSPGFEGMIERTLVALSAGSHLVAANIQASGEVPGDAFAHVVANDCPGDLTDDGVVDLTDIVYFVTAFINYDLEVDFVPNGLLDLADIVWFVNAFKSGCP